jgi:subtilase family serine protease
MRKRIIMAMGGAALLSSFLLTAGASAGTAATARPASHTTAQVAYPHPLAIVLKDHPFTGKSAPTTTQCIKFVGLACYGPKQFETAYNEGPLFRHGLTGAGETIALVDSFGSPTIQSDLATFDSAFGLPAPPSFKIIQPAGKVPAFNKHSGAMQSWAIETSLDVQYSHAMAPGANILLVETPVSETVGVQGFPQIVKAENYVINHGMADVISQSFAAAEATFPSAQSILDLRSSFVNADNHNVTVVSAAGDEGASSPTDGSESSFFTKRAPNWPASDPLVTAVGGTQLHLDNAGQRTFPDNVWNDTNLLGELAAGGGGLSTVFARPAYQDGVESIVGNARGYPDVSMSAAVDGAALVYLGFPGIAPGLYLVGGTSEATPEFAGVVAIADQAAGHSLGLLNNALYTLGEAGAPGLPDIATGNNTVSFVQDGNQYTVDGWVAGPGYDLASGLGTVNAADLVAELAGDGQLTHRLGTSTPNQ